MKKAIIQQIVFSLLLVIFAHTSVNAQNLEDYLQTAEDKEAYLEIKDELEKADAIYQRAQNAKGRKAYRLHKKAAKIHDINYRKLYLLAAPYLEEYAEDTNEKQHKKIRVLNYSASDKLASAITQRRKAHAADKNEATDFFVKAHNLDIKAQDDIAEAFNVYHNNSNYELPENDPYTVAVLEKKKDFSEENFSENSFTPEVTENEKKYPEYKKQTAIESADSEHTYSVQISASKRKDDIAYLKRKYPKVGDIREEYVDGRYKYTFGNFNTYTEATETQKKSGVKGAFVVAYSGNRRLKHITDVLLPQNEKTYETGEVNISQTNVPENNNTENNNFSENNAAPGEIEYRIQIGISRIPASENQISRMNDTDLPVKTLKSGSTYKYTIGSFKTKQEALDYKNTNSLSKTFVVKYKDGQEIH